MRKKTKHADNPVQQIRLICSMTQAEFASMIGCPKGYLRQVECNEKPISWTLESQICIFCGAERRDGEGPFYAIDEQGKDVPFTKARFEEHKKAAVRETFKLEAAQELLEVLKLGVEIAASDKDSEYHHLRIHLICARLIMDIQRFLTDFGLTKGVRSLVPALAKSKDKQQQHIGGWICSLTNARLMMTAWYG